MHEDLLRYRGEKSTEKVPAFVDWRDKATAYAEWGTSAFVGLLIGGFTSCHADWSAWTAIPIAVPTTVVLHWILVRTVKRFL
jgi:uncharacterized protein (DUF983 family)